MWAVGTGLLVNHLSDAVYIIVMITVSDCMLFWLTSHLVEGNLGIKPFVKSPRGSLNFCQVILDNTPVEFSVYSKFLI